MAGEALSPQASVALHLLPLRLLRGAGLRGSAVSPVCAAAGLKSVSLRVAVYLHGGFQTREKAAQASGRMIV